MQVLQFIKTHLVALLCGVVAVAAIAVGVLGMSSGKVVKAIEDEKKRIGATSIRNLKSNPQNEKTIAAIKHRGEKFEDAYVKTVDEAKRINRRKELMGGVFPEAEKVVTPFEFKQEYAKTMRVLWTKLDAGTLPTQAEIQEEAQNVEDLLLLEAEQKAEEEGEESTRAARAPVGRRMPRVPPSGRGRPMPPLPPYGREWMGPGSGRMAPGSERMGPGSGRMAPGGPVGDRIGRIPVAKSGEPKYDAAYRARVAKAKSILCYYDETSFQHSPLEYEEDAPTPEEMWFAQVSLWVQQDVVNAIAELNREAANRVSSGDACVEHVPVKRLVLLRVLGYDTADPAGRFNFPVAGTASLPPTVGGPSLTGRKCNDQFDVVRFVVSVVIDQRDILQLIDRISRVNFYQCLSAGYEAVDHQLARQEGYFYGTDPVVTATLEFEGYMAREAYEELMPAPVRKMLGIDSEDEEG